jgi:hypothetical protein
VLYSSSTCYRFAPEFKKMLDIVKGRLMRLRGEILRNKVSIQSGSRDVSFPLFAPFINLWYPVCYWLRLSTFTCNCNLFNQPLFYSCSYNLERGSGSVVGVATAYGLDGPGIESWWGRDFPYLSRPALRPTQPPVQWVPDLSGG